MPVTATASQNRPRSVTINLSATTLKAIARSIKLEPSGQPGNKRLLRACALPLGERDERSRIRTIAGCRESGNRACPAGGLPERLGYGRSTLESRQRQWPGMAFAPVSGRLVRYLLTARRRADAVSKTPEIDPHKTI